MIKKLIMILLLVAIATNFIYAIGTRKVVARCKLRNIDKVVIAVCNNPEDTPCKISYNYHSYYPYYWIICDQMYE
jgi:hypothetical protein